MKQMIKILHVIGKRPVGGVGTFLINMHSNIDTSKIQFDYLINASILEEGEFDKTVKKLGGNVYILPELKYQNTIKYLKNLRKFYANHNNYKAIHVHTPNIGVFNFAQAKKYGIQNRILHSHNTKYSDKKINSIRNFLMQIPVKKMANVYFACSEKAGDFLFGKKNIRKKEVFIAKNAINAEKFDYDEYKRKNIRKELEIENKFVIGHVGRFNAQKNHDFIIDIFEEIYKKKKDSVLILVGNGELEEKMKQKVNRMNLSNQVHFLGLRNDIPDLLQVFDAFLLPSLFEGLPLVGIEVQAAGLPCIMSDEITEEIKITDSIEFLSLNKDPKYWAEAVLKYEKTKRKSALQEIIVSGYDVKRAAEKLGDFYLRL